MRKEEGTTDIGEIKRTLRYYCILIDDNMLEN